MDYYLELKQKIETRQAVVAVVGLGYVGLPLAIEKARAGYRVLGFDIQQKRVDMVNRGENYIGDVVDSDLHEFVQKELLKAASDYSGIAQADCVTICVPTPLDAYQQPDISCVRNSCIAVAQYAHPGMLIVLESTSYPGTTEEVMQPVFQEKGFTIGKDLFLAFSPERVDPGNRQYNLRNTPKVVSGVTPACLELAALLYKNVLEAEPFRVSSPKVAEMEKIYENTFRNINIALANEMAVLCRQMGIDVWEVIEAAKTKPYGFMAFYPGPGLGGHCIPIDPYYLVWKAKEYHCRTRLIETAGEINDQMPEHVVGQAAELLNRDKKPLNGASVLLLGVSYKKDTDDIRESPALRIWKLLKQESAEVSYLDPFVPSLTLDGEVYESKSMEDVPDADLCIITTDHSQFDAQAIADHSRLVLDTRNLTKGMHRDHVFRI